MKKLRIIKSIFEYFGVLLFCLVYCRRRQTLVVSLKSVSTLFSLFLSLYLDLKSSMSMSVSLYFYKKKMLFFSFICQRSSKQRKTSEWLHNLLEFKLIRSNHKLCDIINLEKENEKERNFVIKYKIKTTHNIIIYLW